MDIINVDSLNKKIEINKETKIINIFETFKEKKNIEIIIDAVESTVLEFNFSYITYEETNLKISLNIFGDNNNCKINIRSISKGNGLSKIIVDGTALSNTKNNTLDENIKIINTNNNKNIIIPNMIIKTNDIAASHGASIGRISNNEIIYLMKKGLSKIESIKLIEIGFLTSILKINSNKKEIIKEKYN